MNKGNSKRKGLAVAAAVLLCFAFATACAGAPEIAGTEAVSTATATVQAESTQIAVPEETASATDATVKNTTQIIWGADGVEITGEGAQVEGGHVLITGGGTYSLSGETADGSVTVNAPGEAVELTLDDVSITNGMGPAVLLKAAEEATVNVPEGTVNWLQDGGDSEYDGALYGVVSYMVRGAGTLNVNGTVEEGVASEMNLVIDGPMLNVTAVDDGINASNDGVSEISINGGLLTIEAGGDGIDSNGSIVINDGVVLTYGALDDMNGGLDADGDVTINGGTVLATGARNTLPAAGSQSYLAFNFDAEQPADSVLTIRNEGLEIFAATIPAAMWTFLLTDSAIEADVDYEIYVNNEQGGTVSTETSITNADGPSEPSPSDR